MPSERAFSILRYVFEASPKGMEHYPTVAAAASELSQKGPEIGLFRMPKRQAQPKHGPCLLSTFGPSGVRKRANNGTMTEIRYEPWSCFPMPT